MNEYLTSTYWEQFSPSKIHEQKDLQVGDIFVSEVLKVFGYISVYSYIKF